ncbi:MAG: hypothetical protein AAF483_19195 [Planctomycetota bacterium]
MQLDKTAIVIRQRNAVELFDLSLMVLRKHFVPIILTSALFGLPFAVFNGLSTAWILSEDSYLVAENLDSPQVWLRWRHLFHNCLLFVLQFQLVSLPTTIFLGNRIFFEPVDFRSLMVSLRKVLWPTILVLGVFRFGILCLCIEYFVDRSTLWDWSAEFFWLIIPACVVLFLRAAWPFAPEIIGLERCPLRKSHPKEITVRERSNGLHRLMVSDNIARFMGAAIVGGMFGLMMLALSIWTKGIVTNDWMWNDWCNIIVVPLSLWFVGLLMTVFRFLSYLDSRIRLEGWEIELRVKAEAARLVRPSVATRSSTLVDDDSREQKAEGQKTEVSST